MEAPSRPCKNCKKKTVIRDEIGNLVCESCGVVQAFDNYQSHFTGINDSIGTFVRIGAASHKGDFNYKEYKIYQASQRIDEITSRFGFSSPTIRKIKQMMEEITDGEFGDGNWFPVFIGACSYVVIRQNNMPYSMAEIALGIGCEVHELGRMITRVVGFLELSLPEFDIIKYFEKSISNCASFSGVGKEKKDLMVKQGRLLLNCAVKWFLTTGRQPVPVVVAVLMFVGEVNQVDVDIEKVASEVHAGVDTCRKRYKELAENLVKVAQALPWGKVVTVKNIAKHAHFVIKYMEIKSRCPGKEKDEAIEFNVEETAHGCLQNVSVNVVDDNGESDSHYFNQNGTRETFNESDIIKISQECLSTIYAQFLSDNDFVKTVDEGGVDHRKRRKKDLSLQVCSSKLRTGESDLSKKLYFKEILEKNVGFDALPVSFVAGELACKRRRERIDAAKQRINKIMQPSGSITNGKNDMTLVKCSQNTKKRKRKEKAGNVDWEDNIIEILLLHQVEEEEIEQGHYKRMLDLYVFDAEKTCKIFGNRK